MKNITFLLTLASLITVSTVAKADNYNYMPYIGADYIYSDASAKGLSPYYNALSLRIGSDYNSYFGTELFFAQSDKYKHHTTAIKHKSSYRSYGLDTIAYLPLGCAKKFSLAATVGIGEYVFKSKNYPHKHYNEHGYGYRFGGGFKYAFNQNWQARFLTRYVKFDHTGIYNHTIEYSAGIEYHFN